MAIRESAKRFNSELKKSISTAIVAAFGLLTALAWKDVITELISEVTSVSPVQSLIINALIITVISVIVIMVITRFTSEPTGK